MWNIKLMLTTFSLTIYKLFTAFRFLFQVFFLDLETKRLQEILRRLKAVSLDTASLSVARDSNFYRHYNGSRNN